MPGMAGALRAWATDRGCWLGRLRARWPHSCDESSARCPKDAPGHALRFALLADREHHQIYYVRRADAGDQSLWLLYLYRFSSVAACAGRESFFRALKLLQSVANRTDGMEQVLGFHHTADCGIILSGTQEEAGHSSIGEAENVEWLDFAAVDGDPLQAAFAALRRGRLSDSLVRFTEAYEAQPFRRAAYVGAGVVADQLGAFEAAETAALMGVRYLPQDDLLLHHLVVVQLRQGRCQDAGASLERLCVRVPNAPSNVLLAGLIALTQDQWWSSAGAAGAYMLQVRRRPRQCRYGNARAHWLGQRGCRQRARGCVVPYLAAHLGFAWPVGVSVGLLVFGLVLAGGAVLSTRSLFA